MSSINLLPDDIKARDQIRNDDKTFVLASVFLILISLIIFGGVYFDKQIASKKLALVNYKIEKNDERITDEIKRHEIFAVNKKIENAESLLLNHPYFSQVLELLGDKITDNVFLEECGFSPDDYNESSSKGGGMTAKDYDSAIDQIASFKSSFLIKDVKINEISLGGGEGVALTGNLKIRKEAILYHEPYWNFGLALLSSKLNNDLKINEYSAVLRRSKKDKIKIKFKGVACNKSSLDLFEGGLAETSFVDKVKIAYSENEEHSKTPQAVDFSGSLEIDY